MDLFINFYNNFNTNNRPFHFYIILDSLDSLTLWTL